MSFFEKLEVKYSSYAIKGLMKYFTVLYVMGFILFQTSPSLYFEHLNLEMSEIMSGQVWRLFTWLIYPADEGLLFGIIMLMLYYRLGTTLEAVWGSFRFNVYMFMGIIFHIIAALVMYFIWGYSIPLTPVSLNTSIFLAFAVTFPDEEFYLYFAIKVKAKVLVIFYLAIEVFNFFNEGLDVKITIFLCLLNFIIFYIMTGRLQRSVKSGARKAQWSAGVNMGKIKSNLHIHRCAVCGKTSLTNPDLEFRYCSKCAGNLEYCSEHIFTHAHVTEETDNEQQNYN